MTDQPTQKTQPKRGEPVDIPIPTRREVLAVLAKTARPKSKLKRYKRANRESSDGKLPS